MTAYEIPLSGANQIFGVTLGETDYRLRFMYRDMPDGGWILDIMDAAGAMIIAGIPLVTGADLLSQYRHLAIGGGGSMWVYTDGAADDVPTFENLGSLAHLSWVPDA